MTNLSHSVVPIVVQQHVEESAHLRGVRSVLVRAPHVNVHHLRRLDDRLAAHLDGIAIAGEYGVALCTAMLENPHKGHVFTAAVRAMANGDAASLNKLLALAEAMPELQAGLFSAAGWVSGRFLQGTARNLLESKSAFQRRAGIVVCIMHQVDPGAALEKSLLDQDQQLRARGLRSAGESGRLDLLAACVLGIDDDDAMCRYWAARSAALLGERDKALTALTGLVLHDAGLRPFALPALLKLLEPPPANALLKQLAQDPSCLRLLIKGSGMSGDPSYVPWLLNQMEDLKLARLAGEAFTMITGLDLSLLDLDRKPPAQLETGPNDDPDDADIAMDEDDDLPWPDPARIRAWWQGNHARFPVGVRFFMGEPIAVAHCKKVLREGYQRQRIVAAEYLCLLQPGTALFPTSAPAWRQERWLNKAT